MLNDNDTDPDKIFYGEILGNGDKYYPDVQFNNISKDNSRFSLLHVNARRLNTNLDKLILYLGIMQHSFSVNCERIMG